MPLELELTVGSPLVWLGLIRGMDHLKPLPAKSGPRVDKRGLLFRADEWALSVAPFSRPAHPRTSSSHQPLQTHANAMLTWEWFAQDGVV